jgi:hypothetical protein
MRNPVMERLKEDLAADLAARTEQAKRRAYRDITIALVIIVWMSGWAALTPNAWRTGLGPIALVVTIGAALWLRRRLRRALSGE